MATFADWTERLKVYNDYIKAMGQYAKDVADAALTRAKTAGEWQKIAAIQMILKELMIAQNALKTEEYKVKQEIDRIRNQERRAILLLRGARIDSFQEAWAAYLWFQGRAMAETGDKLFKIKVGPDARSPDNFIDNSKPANECEELPASVKNVLGLAAWLKEKKYMAKNGSAAQELLAQLFSEINNLAAETVTKLRDHITEIDKQEFDLLKHPAIPGVAASPAAAKVERAAEKIANLA